MIPFVTSTPILWTVAAVIALCLLGIWAPGAALLMVLALGLTALWFHYRPLQALRVLNAVRDLWVQIVRGRW